MYNYAGLIDEGLVPDKTPDDTAKYLYQALRAGSDQVLTQLTTRPDMFKAPARKALQKILKEHSFYLGPLDGDFGKNTKPPSKKGLRPARLTKASGPRDSGTAPDQARSSQPDTAPRPEPNFPHHRFKNIPRGNAALGPSTNAALGV